MFVSFTHPIYLAFLFAIPVLVFFHFFGLKTIRGRSLKFANFKAIARIKGIDLYSKNIFLLIFNIFFVVLLVLTLAGLTLHSEVEASSFSFVVAIDNSQSMSALDLEPNRIGFAKQVARDFVNSLPYESYLGVTSFSGESSTLQGLTKNKQEIIFAINSIEVSEIGGTDVFDAVSNAVKLLGDEENKAIVLLSDGQINTGSIDEAIDYAKFNNVLIHTIAIGTVAGGETSYGLSKLDEESLKSLAYNTDGRYFNVNNQNKIIDPFNEIIKPTRRLGSIELSFYLIIAVIVLFLVKQFLLSINKIMW